MEKVSLKYHCVQTKWFASSACLFYEKNSNKGGVCFAFYAPYIVQYTHKLNEQWMYTVIVTWDSKWKFFVANVLEDLKFFFCTIVRTKWYNSKEHVYIHTWYSTVQNVLHCSCEMTAHPLYAVLSVTFIFTARNNYLDINQPHYCTLSSAKEVPLLHCFGYSAIAHLNLHQKHYLDWMPAITRCSMYTPILPSKPKS